MSAATSTWPRFSSLVLVEYSLSAGESLARGRDRGGTAARVYASCTAVHSGLRSEHAAPGAALARRSNRDAVEKSEPEHPWLRFQHQACEAIEYFIFRRLPKRGGSGRPLPHARAHGKRGRRGARLVHRCAGLFLPFRRSVTRAARPASGAARRPRRTSQGLGKAVRHDVPQSTRSHCCRSRSTRRPRRRGDAVVRRGDHDGAGRRVRAERGDRRRARRAFLSDA